MGFNHRNESAPRNNTVHLGQKEVASREPLLSLLLGLGETQLFCDGGVLAHDFAYYMTMAYYIHWPR